ncbi:MAG: DUF5683 domain-containing protein [Crocinitomicaceae bacterium]|jgi:hypothetical protein
MKRIFILVFCLYQAIFFGQTDSLKKDSIPHPYKKAMLFSACLPGAGQIYNSLNAKVGPKKAYWKVPLIYTALGTAGYFLVTNQMTQKSLKDEYTFRINNNNQTLNQTWVPYDNQAILTLYRQYLDWRDLSILGLAAIYFIQIADAGVEAHFLNFDVSDNLSLRVNPVLMNSKTAGIQLQFSLRSK